MKSVLVGLALAIGLSMQASAAEIVSLSAKNVGLARWLIRISYMQDTASDPNNAVWSIVMVPDVGGENCVRMDTNPFKNGLHRLTQTCRGVPYGTKYLTVYLNTLNHRHQDSRKVYLKK